MQRRTALGGLGAGLAATLGLTGCGSEPSPPGPIDPPRPDQPPQQEPLACAPVAAMTRVDRLGGCELIYEVDQQSTAFPVEPGFLTQLETWQQYWVEHSGLPVHDQVWTYGAYVAQPDCNSWHGAGRAFDFSRLRSNGVPVISCRQDLWSQMSDRELADRHRRRYWAFAASLHLHFAYVLTYLYNDLHRNHIHVDNSVSRSGMSVFDPRSRVQIQVLQSVCSYLWDVPVEPTGVWDNATREATASVLDQLGGSGDIGDADNWERFLDGSVGRAAD